jgi:putative SOS response-associated peptidase YedK
MCGKFTQMASWREVVDFSDALTATGGPAETVMPMRFATVVCLDEQGARVTRKMRWGAAKKGAATPGNKPEHIHAQAEKLDTYWLYLAQQRGILIAQTFNEGQEVGSKTVQHTLTPNDRQPLGIAVIYEKWEQEGGEELYTFIMMTTPANHKISTITDRMPAILAPEKWAIWLGETDAPLDEAKALLVPVDGDWAMNAEQSVKAKPTRPRPAGDAQPTLF